MVVSLVVSWLCHGCATGCVWQEVFKSRGFNEMSEDAVAFVLQSDRLRMDEADILEKVTEWATVNSVSRRDK